MSTITTVRRSPTVDEYLDLIRSVGWKARNPRAIADALRNSVFAVVARLDDATIAMGRVIGDGGLHYYLSDVAVRPEFQRRGIGTRIVRELQQFLDGVPYDNTLVSVVATPATHSF